ncbi:MAG: hypothetical protein V7K98_09445 [Nostoc sp.]
MQEGLKQGIEEKVQEVAVNMLNSGIAIALVASIGFLGSGFCT